MRRVLLPLQCAWEARSKNSAQKSSRLSFPLFGVHPRRGRCSSGLRARFALRASYAIANVLSEPIQQRSRCFSQKMTCSKSGPVTLSIMDQIGDPAQTSMRCTQWKQEPRGEKKCNHESILRMLHPVHTGRAMLALENYVRNSSGLEPSLLELVRMRASQINGCAYCLDMHSKDARATGESEQRLYALSAWQETPFFTDRERVALAWSEAITLITSGRASDEDYEQARQSFSEEELVNLTLSIVAINGWNRLSVGFRTVPGSYQPANDQATASARSR